MTFVNNEGGKQGVCVHMYLQPLSGFACKQLGNFVLLFLEQNVDSEINLSFLWIN